MTAPIVMHTSRVRFPLESIVQDGVHCGFVVDGDRAGVPRRTARGQLWERVAEIQPRHPALFPAARIDPASSLYCRQCDYDDHYCGGCGETLAHGQSCKEDHD